MIMSPTERANSYDRENLPDMGDQNEVEVICSICYVSIEEGHRVGVPPRLVDIQKGFPPLLVEHEFSEQLVVTDSRLCLHGEIHVV